jgi:hypothetical protein
MCSNVTEIGIGSMRRQEVIVETRVNNYWPYFLRDYMAQFFYNIEMELSDKPSVLYTSPSIRPAT